MDLEFKRNTDAGFMAGVPKSMYTEGSVLYFTAKQLTDDDPSNSKAVLNLEFNHDDIASQTDDKVYFYVHIKPEDTAHVKLEGAAALNLLGELTLVTPNGSKHPSPLTEYMNITILANVRNS